jgi:hypothetical protein
VTAHDDLSLDQARRGAVDQPVAGHRTEDPAGADTTERPAGEQEVRNDPRTQWPEERAGERTAIPLGEHTAESTAEDEPIASAVEPSSRPTAAAEFTVEHLIDPADADRFRGSWRDVKAGFVDDPSDALRRASALSGEVVDELTAVLGQLRQDLDQHWQDGEGTDTERLRVALRGYGFLLDRILTR